MCVFYSMPTIITIIICIIGLQILAYMINVSCVMEKQTKQYSKVTVTIGEREILLKVSNVATSPTT